MTERSDSATRPRLSRRGFLATAAAAGGGLALGFRIPAGAAAAMPAEVNAWIVIQPDDAVIIRVARAEMGQGIATALPMLVAEELECEWAKVRAEFVRPDESLRRKRAWGDLSTGNSRSVSASEQALRKAGATAREMLIAAAAARWDVPPHQCGALAGQVIHRPSGRTLRFGEIAAEAAGVAPPPRVALKAQQDWKLIGTPRRRLDLADKVTGKAIYGTDVRLPGMLYAAIAQCPVFAGKLKSVDDGKAGSRDGVVQVVRLSDAVAVVAKSWWHAKQALDRLAIAWEPGEGAGLSSIGIRSALSEALGSEDAETAFEEGEVDAALEQSARVITADYAVPYLAHATMEPQNCTASVTAGGVEVWAPTQNPEATVAIAAAAAGVPAERVIVHRTVLGGGFGRRGVTQDYVPQAIAIAQQVGRPVQLIWSREEDIRHDFYRPMVAARLSAALDAQGAPLALKVRIAGQSIMAALSPGLPGGAAEKHFVEGFGEEALYGIANRRVEVSLREYAVPVGFWRGVNHTQNAFFRESFVDELAYAAGTDPYGFRRDLLASSPRALRVLDAAAERAEWAKPAAGRCRGIAINEASGTICAQVVEASVEAGRVRVHRVVAAIDPGRVVNPLTVELQTQSAIVYALTAALHGEIGIREGAVEQSNFHDYEMLRMADMPRIETVIVASGAPWGGIGEPPVPPLAPALCNAIFAATGKRIRSLPLKNHDLRRA